jgi:hypothetical protein
VVSNKFNGKELVAQIGTEPDESWTSGEFRKPGLSQVRSRTSGVRFRSGLPNDAPLIEHINAILERVEPFADGFGKLAADSSSMDPDDMTPDPRINLWILISARTDEQLVELDRRQIAALASIGCDLEIRVIFDVEVEEDESE